MKPQAEETEERSLYIVSKFDDRNKYEYEPTGRSSVGLCDANSAI